MDSNSVVVINATYSGDGNNPPSSAAFGLSVSMRASKTFVGCAPSSVKAGSLRTVHCFAHVGGYFPTGSVTWSEVSGPGAIVFSPDTCTLVAARCSVTLNGILQGKVVIQASYGGDANNFGSARNHNLNIRAPIRTTVILRGGSAFVDQTRFTGVNVTLTGSSSPNGTRVVVTSSDMRTYRPAGTNASDLNSTTYYDVQVLGATGGNTMVCISSAALTEGSVIEYWNGSGWVAASDQTTNGTVICGAIPTSDLGGTPIVVGTS